MPVAPECPIFPGPESSARITERGPEFNGAWRGPGEAAFCLKSGLSAGGAGKISRAGSRKYWRSRGGPSARNPGFLRNSAMLSASQMPIAVSATVKAKAARLASMRCRKSSGSSRRALKARQVAASCRAFLRLRLAGRLCRGTRPELEHAVLVIRADGPLGFHCCRSEGVSARLSSTSGRALQLMLT